MNTARESVGVVLETGYNKPLIRFSIFQGGPASKLAICLSHALYDDTSFETLCHELSSAYLGLPLGAPAPQFHNFSTELSHKQGLESQHFWKTLLRDSKMINIVAIEDKNSDARSSLRNIEDSEVSTRMRCPSSGSTFGFTFASFLKAAWALGAGSQQQYRRRRVRACGDHQRPCPLIDRRLDRAMHRVHFSACEYQRE
jgi:hypothetical protein